MLGVHIHVGFVNLRGEALIVLLYVFVCIFCMKTFTQKVLPGSGIMFDV